MMEILYIVLFVIIELAYFRIADHFNIIDKPNLRSSHTTITLRGGGILFPIAWLLGFVLSGFQHPWMVAGLLLLSVVSFWDDVRSLSSGIRFGAQFVALGFMFYDLQLVELMPWYGIIAACILSVATLNAINFMDGINGMTGLYGLTCIGSLLLYQHGFNGIASTSPTPTVLLLLALLVFGLFNFRKKAKCFAGDIGSISLGYILIFLLLQHILPASTSGSEPATGWHMEWILLLTVYGIDSMFTIFQRLWNKENILQPHRKHLYQYLANELKWPHLIVAGLYAVIQMVVNALVLQHYVSGYACWIMLIGLGVVYVIVKRVLHIQLFKQ